MQETTRTGRGSFRDARRILRAPCPKFFVEAAYPLATTCSANTNAFPELSAGPLHLHPDHFDGLLHSDDFTPERELSSVRIAAADGTNIHRRSCWRLRQTLSAPVTILQAGMLLWVMVVSALLRRTVP